MFLFVEKCICQSAETSIHDKHCHLWKGRMANEHRSGEGAPAVGGVTLIEWGRCMRAQDEKALFPIKHSQVLMR